MCQWPGKRRRGVARDCGTRAPWLACAAQDWVSLQAGLISISGPKLHYFNKDGTRGERAKTLGIGLKLQRWPPGGRVEIPLRK